jgi:hypothetical protein
MAQPAPGKKPEITPNQTINVTSNNGVLKPSVDPASIPVGGAVEFNNQTSEDITVELFTKNNDHRVAISVYVPAGGQAYLCNDPQHDDSRCYYNLAPYPPQAGIKDTPSGSHSIIITSGNPDQ